MPRIGFRDFAKGWWPVSPGSEIPRNALREAQGVRTFFSKALKSRFGNQTVAQLGRGILSVFVWRGLIFYSTSPAPGVLARLSLGSPNPTNVIGNLGGGPIHFATGVPTPEIDADGYQDRNVSHLFMVGSGVSAGGVGYVSSVFPCRKIDVQLRDSPMGLDPPPDNFSLSLQDAVRVIISGFSLFDIGQYVTSGAATKGPTGRRQTGFVAMFVSVPSDNTGAVTKTHSIDLGRYNVTFNGVAGAAESVKQDWIRLWVHVDDPSHIDHIELIFDCGGPDTPPAQSEEGWDKSFSYSIYVADSVQDRTIAPKGVTDFEGAIDKRDISPFAADGTLRPTHNFSDVATAENAPALEIADVESARIVSELASSKISPTTNTWTHLRIPKMLFQASSETMLFDQADSWAKVRRYRFVIVTNDKGSAVVTFDDLDLHLGVGMQGDYKVALTYRNSISGTRSNPSIVKEVKNNLRQAIIISNITFTGETGAYADQIEEWKTLGGGNVLFLAKRVFLSTFVSDNRIFDIVADYEGVQESTNLPGLGPTKYLKLLTLPQDNLRLSRLTFDIAGPHLGRMFSLAWQQRGRAFYSPPGRLEVIAGFIEITTEDNPVRRLVLWNTMWAFSEKKIYELQGTQEPFSFREIFGVPGTFFPESIVVTPFGIAYYENDGARLFNGSTAPLIAPDAVAAYFQSEGTSVTPILDSTFLQSTHGRPVIYGAYHEEEYFLSDGQKTLAVHLRTGVWRTIGLGFGPSHTESTFGNLIAMTSPANVNAKLSVIEISTQETDGGTAIPFSVELPATIAEDQSGATKIVQRVYFDVNTRGEVLTATLLITGAGGVLALDPIVTGSRQLVEQSLCQAVDVVGVRLTGQLVHPVELYEWGVDVHLPEEGGQNT